MKYEEEMKCIACHRNTSICIVIGGIVCFVLHDVGVRIMVFNAIIFQLYHGWLVLFVEETGSPEKTTDLSQVIENLYHIM